MTRPEGGQVVGNESSKSMQQMPLLQSLLL
jgi:hypothetical protein